MVMMDCAEQGIFSLSREWVERSIEYQWGLCQAGIKHSSEANQLSRKWACTMDIIPVRTPKYRSTCSKRLYTHSPGICQDTALTPKLQRQCIAKGI